MTTEIMTNTTDLLSPEIISPEGLEVAECYLANGGDSKKAALDLNLPAEVIEKQLKNPEVKGYISRIFNETGFRNKHRLFGLMDQIINLKIDEMDETGVGSSADILDVMKAMHAMKLAEMKMEVELEKVKQTAAPTSQTNVQINNNSMPGSEDAGYMDVLNLLAGKK